MTTHHHHHTPELTRNQALVLAELAKAEGPLSAYTILDQLREEGFRAPLQVYRALDKLVAFGLVHRLESLNAFVACSQSGCESHSTVAFAICEVCGQVQEIADAALDDRLTALAGKNGFTLARSVVELRGKCSRCQLA